MNFDTDFISRVSYELKRAERYRVFLSLAIFNIGSVIDLAGKGVFKTEEERDNLCSALNKVIKDNSREVDFISNSGAVKIGVLMPETSRQGAEAAARRITESLFDYCKDYFAQSSDYSFPVEVSSFPDSSDSRSIASYIEEFKTY
jgi:hypothetical protein